MARRTRLTACLDDQVGQGRAGFLFVVSLNCRASFLVFSHGAKLDHDSIIC
jgi:hypothetical protein